MSYISFCLFRDLHCVSVSQGSSSLPEIQVFAISYIEDKFIPDNDDISWIKKEINSCIQVIHVCVVYKCGLELLFNTWINLKVRKKRLPGTYQLNIQERWPPNQNW